jgi:hypothetical protein
MRSRLEGECRLKEEDRRWFSMLACRVEGSLR